MSGNEITNWAEELSKRAAPRTNVLFLLDILSVIAVSSVFD